MKSHVRLLLLYFQNETLKKAYVTFTKFAISFDVICRRSGRWQEKCSLISKSLQTELLCNMQCILRKKGINIALNSEINRERLLRWLCADSYCGRMERRYKVIKLMKKYTEAYSSHLKNKRGMVVKWDILLWVLHFEEHDSIHRLVFNWMFWFLLWGSRRIQSVFCKFRNQHI